MKVLLKRKFKGPKYTIGSIYINDKYFCDSLEDPDRNLNSLMSEEEIKQKKVYGNTAIPTGIYEVVTNIVSPKFSNFNKYKWAKYCNGKLPRLLNVPGFTGILIHVGNTQTDTSGCILLGENKIKGKVINSTVTFNKFIDILNSRKSNEKIFIKII